MKVTQSYDPDRRKIEVTINAENGRGPYSFSTDYDATGWAGIEFAKVVASNIANCFDTEVIQVDPPEEW